MKKHILIVDDDFGISEVIKIILRDSGYETTTINNGFNIEKIVMKIKPDLILLDIWMSGVDGREVVKILRKNKRTSKIPIVLISALSNTEQMAMDTGADGFLPKPFDITDLLSIVKTHVNSVIG